jgi:hypothetical protein
VFHFSSESIAKLKAEENNGFRASTQREVALVARILEPYNGIQPLQLQLLLEPVDEIVGLGVHLIITLHHPNLSEREKQEEEEADVGKGVEDSHALRRENRVEKCLVSP